MTEQYRPSINELKEEAARKTAASQERRAKKAKTRKQVAGLGLASVAVTAAIVGVGGRCAPSTPENMKRPPEKTSVKLPEQETLDAMEAEKASDAAAEKARIEKALEPQETKLPKADDTGEQTEGFR
jgi:hypothetical protein